MWPPLRSAKVGVMDEWRTARCHHGDRPGVQNELDTRGAHPRSMAHFLSRMSPQVVVHPVCHA